MTIGNGNRVITDHSPDRLQKLVDDAAKDFGSMPPGQFRETVQRMFDHIAEHPKDIGTERVVHTPIKLGLRQFSPKRTPGINAGQLSKSRILYSVQPGKQDGGPPVVAIYGIYDHKGFESAIKTLRGN